MLTGTMPCLYAGRFCELPSFTQITLNCMAGWELEWELDWGARVCDWEPSRGAPLRWVFVTVQLCKGLPVRRLCFPGVAQGTPSHLPAPG